MKESRHGRGSSVSQQIHHNNSVFREREREREKAILYNNQLGSWYIYIPDDGSIPWWRILDAGGASFSQQQIHSQSLVSLSRKTENLKLYTLLSEREREREILYNNTLRFWYIYIYWMMDPSYEGFSTGFRFKRRNPFGEDRTSNDSVGNNATRRNASQYSVFGTSRLYDSRNSAFTYPHHYYDDHGTTPYAFFLKLISRIPSQST